MVASCFFFMSQVSAQRQEVQELATMLNDQPRRYTERGHLAALFLLHQPGKEVLAPILMSTAP